MIFSLLNEGHTLKMLACLLFDKKKLIWRPSSKVERRDKALRAEPVRNVTHTTLH